MQPRGLPHVDVEQTWSRVISNLEDPGRKGELSTRVGTPPEQGAGPVQGAPPKLPRQSPGGSPAPGAAPRTPPRDSAGPSVPAPLG